MSFWTSTKRKRRKPHRCDICGQDVHAGDYSFDEAGTCDGSFSSYKQCKACRDIVQYFFWNGTLDYAEGFLLFEIADLAREEGLVWPPVWNWSAPSTFADDFATGLQLSADLVDAGFEPLREQWIRAAHSDLMAAIEQRLAELPKGWRLAVSDGQIERGDQPGDWQLRHRFIAIDPDCPDPLPVPATPQRWTLYGPNRRDTPNAV